MEKSFPTATSATSENYYTLYYNSKDLINELSKKVPEDVIFLEENFEGDPC